MSTSSPASSVLIIDGDIISRHAIADYLRHCGYAVVEAVSTDEAMQAFREPGLSIDVILCDMAAIGTHSGFELARWVHQNRPELEVRLTGSTDRTVDAAADLCESGPHLARPYDPSSVVDYIKKLRASRAKAERA